MTSEEKAAGRRDLGPEGNEARVPGTRAGSIYARLLRLLPGSLREGFEEEIKHDFLMRLREASGLLEKARVWGLGLWDLFVAGVSEALVRRTRAGRAARGGPDPEAAGGPPPTGTGGPRPKRGGSTLEALLRDLRYGARTLRKSPSFTLVAVLTLGVGIGGATVAFSLVRGVLLRPLPFPADEALVVIRQLDPEGEEQTLSFPNFEDFRSQSQHLQGIAALRFPHGTTILGGAEPASGVVVPVSREFFTLLGVPPLLGRPILPEENRPGGDPVAVVGYGYWSRYLGSRELLNGLRITVEGTSYAVVGVMPPGFKVLEDADVYLPMERNPQRIRDSSNYRGIGRLGEGATLVQARAELNGIALRLEEAYPEEARLTGVVMRPLREEILGAVTRPLYLLLGASGIVLLLACSNVASTLMARSVGRGREMAIRTALGGGRARLLRLVFAESLILAGLSGLLGVGLTLGTLRSLDLLGADFIPRLATVSVDSSVLAFAVGASLATSLLFGLLPALRIPAPASSLRSASLGNAPSRGGLGWRLLVGGQVALTASLLVASGLLLQSIREILSADTGFRSEGVLTVALDFTAAGFGSLAEGQARVAALASGWRSLPGVRAVGMVSYLPTTRTMMTGTVFRPPLPKEGLPEHMAGPVGWRVVDPSYFRAMNIPLLKGRFFEATDDGEAPPVIILNASLERALFPGGDAVGSFVGFEPFWRHEELEVVGVVAEARDWRVPAGEQMEGYVLMSQRPGYASYMTAVLRTDGDPAGLIGPARERLRGTFPSVAGTFETLDTILAESFRDRTFTLGILGAFALLSLFLSAVGIFGVVGYTVSARAREIGIMLALGAGTGRLRRTLFLQSAWPVGLGVAVGLFLAILAGGVLESILFGVTSTDPFALTAAPLVLLCSASLAILVPVVRFTRVDPAGPMREE